MSAYAKPVEVLIDELGRLPGVGPKSAQRIAFHLLKVDRVDAQRLADAIVDLKDSVSFCETCFNVAEGSTCGICTDSRRDQHVLCVVEEPKDIAAIEKTGAFKGRYHVLGGTLSALDAVGPDELRIPKLVDRVSAEEVTEIILALNATVDGQTTAHYIAERLEGSVTVTSLAQGVPIGGELDYLDDGTITAALKARKSL